MADEKKVTKVVKKVDKVAVPGPHDPDVRKALGLDK